MKWQQVLHWSFPCRQRFKSSKSRSTASFPTAVSILSQEICCSTAKPFRWAPTKCYCVVACSGIQTLCWAWSYSQAMRRRLGFPKPMQNPIQEGSYSCNLCCSLSESIVSFHSSRRLICMLESASSLLSVSTKLWYCCWTLLWGSRIQGI